MPIFTHRSPMPVPASRLWEWHTRPGAFDRLCPPWERVRVREGGAELQEGERITLELRKGPLKLNWVAQLENVRPGEEFTDRQLSGPFARWVHRHRFVADGPDRSLLIDEIDYALPGGALARWLGGGLAEGKLRQLFHYRHAITRGDLERYFGEPPPPPGPAGRVLVTGASGLVGQALVPLLKTLGYAVVTLSRNPWGPDGFAWNPDAGELDDRALKGVDAVVHLAGENIAGGRWTPARRSRILESRRRGTRLLAEAIAKREKPPVLVSMSGANHYPLDGKPHGESSYGTGDGFLASVCREWEAATEPATQAGARVVVLRAGVVLSPAGGALAKMLPAFLFGAGGPIGSGRQHMSWIALDDLLDIIVSAIRQPAWSGPFNAVAPAYLPQREFARILGRVLRRPAFMPLPAPLVRLLFGQMGEETLLADLAVQPERLQAEGFAFRLPTPEAALRHLLGRVK